MEELEGMKMAMYLRRALLLDGCAGTSKLLSISKSKVIYILWPIKTE
jgi:hypothetical protein